MKFIGTTLAFYISNIKIVKRRYEFEKQMMALIVQEKIIHNFEERVITGTISRDYSWEKIRYCRKEDL